LRHDPAIADVAVQTGSALVLMHMRGSTSDMYRHATYADVVSAVAAELAASVTMALAAGVSRGAIVVDPGIGFAKQAAHSWDIVSRLDHPALRALDLPMLVGASRKSFLQAAIGECSAPERDPASLVVAALAALSGSHIVRVHDVAGSVQAVRVADMISATAAAGPS
jgi:dihydropteroate synthase